MATITFNTSLTPNNAFLNVPTEIDPVATASSSIFEVGDQRFTTLRLEGIGFTYTAAGEPIAGTLTSFSLRQGGVTTVTVSGLSPLLTLAAAESLRLDGTPGALMRYLLSGDDVAMSGDGDQVIISEGGNDTLDGGAGADYIVAGDGDDLVLSGLGQGPHNGAVEMLLGGEWADRLIIDRSDQALAFVFDVMAAGVMTMLDGTHIGGFEQIEFRSGSGSDQLSGGDLDDFVDAGSGSDRISGRGGDDTLWGGAGADNVDGGTGNDIITGDEGIDALDGGSGNDSIDGGAQADNLFGGSGNDVLYGASGADNIDGGADDDLIDGGSGIDILDGGSGSDTIDGGSEADDISRGDGNDILNGGLGADHIEGGGGNDVLEGGSGPDVLLGGPGDDLYYVDNLIDVVFDGLDEGYDRVVASTSYALGAPASIEFLCTVDPMGKAAIDLKGNGIANVIEGNAGANRIYGLDGNDTLRGGRGRDTFVFNTKPSKKNVDKILDFRVKDDTIQLSRSIFNKLTYEEKNGHKVLSAAAFHITKAAEDEDDRIIYNVWTGKLYYDEDGTGPAKPVLFAKLAKGLKLTENDFWL